MYIEHLGAEAALWNIQMGKSTLTGYEPTWERQTISPRIHVHHKGGQGNGYIRAQQASGPRGKGDIQAGPSISTETKPCNQLILRSEKAPWFLGHHEGTQGLQNPFNPILARTWVLPLNTNPSVWSPLPVVNQVPQMVPACTHRSSSGHSWQIPILTSMTTVTSWKLLCLLSFG